MRLSLKHRGAGEQRRGWGGRGGAPPWVQPGQLQDKGPHWPRSRGGCSSWALLWGQRPRHRERGRKRKTERKKREVEKERETQKAGDRKVVRKRLRERREEGERHQGSGGEGNGEQGGGGRGDGTRPSEAWWYRAATLLSPRESH